MNSAMFPTPPVDASRLPEGQAAWVQSLLTQILGLLSSLTREERALYTQTWKQMARHNAPVITRSFVQTGQSSHAAQQIVASLNKAKLMWFDNDLHAILQCPPFSVLHTIYEVKAFGWERTYMCSFVDMPLALLVYGPNVWLDCASRCPRSGEKLAFRVRMGEDYRLQVEAPPNQWRVWLPLLASTGEDAYRTFHHMRPRISAFYSLTDLQTHQQYHEGSSGVVYTLEQSLYLSECLMQAYRYAAG